MLGIREHRSILKENAMKSFCVAADSGCDLPIEFFKENGAYPIHMEYLIGTDVFFDLMTESDIKEFYKKMKSGAVVKTAQINTDVYLRTWENAAKEGLPILHLCMSSGISGSWANCMRAAEEFNSSHPETPVTPIDMVMTSLGHGMHVMEAIEFAKNGTDIKEAAKFFEDVKHKTHAIFTTSDLTYLCRGGRVSKAGKFFAHTLNIQPILKLNYDGCLHIFEKGRGDADTMKKIEAAIEKFCIDPQSQTLYVSHADCFEKAERMANHLKEKFGFKDIYYSYIGSTIGAHTGPGLVSLFFYGTDRID